MRRSHHVDLRGSSLDRWRRRQWLLSPAAGFGGNGTSVPCYHCRRRVRNFEVDRFPLCGHAGGRYTRDNIVPACAKCNGGRHPAGRCRAGVPAARAAA